MLQGVVWLLDFHAYSLHRLSHIGEKCPFSDAAEQAEVTSTFLCLRALIMQLVLEHKTVDKQQKR